MADLITRESPDSLSIGDVSKICSIPVHTIRYWECEFEKFLKPSRTVGRQRRYEDQDIRKILRVKELLWTRRYSVKAAKRILNAGLESMVSMPTGYQSSHDSGLLVLRLAQLDREPVPAAESFAA